MYCSNCGKQCNEGAKFCEQCGNPINQITSQQQNTQTKEATATSNMLTLIAFFLFFPAPFLCRQIGLSVLNGLFYLVGLTLLIYTRVKYPNNIWAKVLMWLVIIYFIIMVILGILLWITCIETCGKLG